LETESLENGLVAARATADFEEEGRLPRLAPRHATLACAIGRAAAVAIAVVVTVLVFSDLAWGTRVATAVVQAAIWMLAAALGYSLGGPASTALGPRIAVGRGVLIGILGSAASAAWFPWQHFSPALTFASAAAVFIVSAQWESLALKYIAPTRRLLIVGSSPGAAGLIHDIHAGRGGGYVVIGTVQDGDSVPASFEDVPLLGRIGDLDRVITSAKPDIVVLAPGPNRPEAFQRLLDAAEAGFRVVELAQFYEHAYGRVPVENLTRAWFMSVLHLYQRPYSRVVKRTLDVVGAGFLLALTLPLFPLLTFFVRRTSGPVILRQLRLGEHGKLFTVYKFRTMRADAEAPGIAVWADAADTRITRTGGIMRRLRLDELPQLWNVLRGDMSLVGPRPERPEFLAELMLRVPYWTRRHLVKPGLTGWAQVRQGYTATAEATSEKLSYDLWYIRHRSLTVDLAILLRTVAVVLQGDPQHRPRAVDELSSAAEYHSSAPIADVR
jgi:exopolysaccharide biosynthesis polyprenyl glycosylphosphotransferase